MYKESEGAIVYFMILFKFEIKKLANNVLCAIQYLMLGYLICYKNSNVSRKFKSMKTRNWSEYSLHHISLS